MSRADEIDPAYDYQEGYEGEYPPDWLVRRKAAKNRDGHTCQDCRGRSDALLHVHRITPPSDGGSNRLSNLTTLCADCHNDRHDYDVGSGYEYPPGAFSDGPWWMSLRGVVRYGLGAMVLLALHIAALSALLTQSVGTPLWFVGGGYVVGLVGLGLWNPLYLGRISTLYGLAGVGGVAIMEVMSVGQIGGESASMLAFTAFVIALLARLLDWVYMWKI